jgi:hypothetical protein
MAIRPTFSSPRFRLAIGHADPAYQGSRNLLQPKNQCFTACHWDSFRRPQEVFAAIMELQKNSAKPYELDENVATEATPEFCLMMSKP